MSKIKLRAFDKKRGCMLPLEEDPDYMFGIDEKGCLYLIRNGNPMKDEDYELIRFTGLLDKNGKEIYEGDIFGSQILRCVVTRMENGEYRLVFKNKTIDSISILDRKIAESEVIGNRFENPELLK